MVSRSSQYQCLLWAANVHCFEWCVYSVLNSSPTFQSTTRSWEAAAVEEEVSVRPGGATTPAAAADEANLRRRLCNLQQVLSVS